MTKQKTVGQYIKKIRGKNGLSQAALGRKIGKTRFDIAKYELDINIPPGDYFWKIIKLDPRVKGIRWNA